MTLKHKKNFSDFFLISAADEWIAMKWIKIDWHNLQTGTAIGSSASHEH